MINQLASEQKKLLDRICDEWRAYGQSTEPADRVEAERGVREAYTAAGLAEPRRIVWCDSPMAGGREASRLTEEGGENNFWHQAWSQVRDQAWDQTRGQVKGEVWHRVLEQVFDQVWGGEAQDQVKGQIPWRNLGGQHDAAWLAWLDFWSRVLPGMPDVSGLLRVGRSAGWWWPLEGAVVLTERHTTLHLDGQNRLHCEDGPSVAYPDGWGVYAWHGTPVPEDFITEGWDIQRILNEENTEVRRCAIERMGWERFVKEARLKQVGEPQPDPGNPGQTLSLYDVPPEIYGDGEHVRVLLCRNASPERDGTRRRYGLAVPDHISSPLAAAAWSFGLSSAEYEKMDRAS